MVPASDSREAADYRVLFHEYAHALLHLNLRRLPAWVDEGMAEFYSTFEGDFRDGKSLIGRPPFERLQDLRGRALLPLSQLLTSEGAYKFTRDRVTVGTFYAQSWALVHYLQVGDGGKRQGQLTRYLKMLEEGRPISEAFQGAFETTFDALQRELQSYVSRSTFQAALVDPGTTVLLNAMEPMTEADARFVQGDLLLKAGAAKDADDEFVKILANEPAHADARVGRAEVQRQDGKLNEAIASLQDIASANPTNVRVRNALVTALQGARRYEEALAAGREAVKLNDGSASTWFAISVAELAQGRESESNSALVRADALLPETQWYRARAYSAYELARHDVVVRDAAIHLDRVRTDSDAAPYTAFLGALSYRKLKQPDQSMQILDRAAAAIVPGSWAEQVLLFLQDRSSAADFLRKAKTTGERTEAHAYIGKCRRIASDRAEGAVEHLQWVQEKGAHNFVEVPAGGGRARSTSRMATSNHRWCSTRFRSISVANGIELGAPYAITGTMTPSTVSPASTGALRHRHGDAGSAPHLYRSHRRSRVRGVVAPVLERMAAIRRGQHPLAGCGVLRPGGCGTDSRVLHGKADSRAAGETHRAHSTLARRGIRFVSVRARRLPPGGGTSPDRIQVDCNVNASASHRRLLDSDGHRSYSRLGCHLPD